MENKMKFFLISIFLLSSNILYLLNTFNSDPMPTLIKTKQVIETYAGVYALQGDFLESINYMDSIFKKYAFKRGAIEQHFQPTLPTQSLLKNGYISSFPHHPLFVAPIERKIDSINSVAQRIKDDNHGFNKKRLMDVSNQTFIIINKINLLITR